MKTINNEKLNTVIYNVIKNKKKKKDSVYYFITYFIGNDIWYAPWSIDDYFGSDCRLEKVCYDYEEAKKEFEKLIERHKRCHEVDKHGLLTLCKWEDYTNRELESYRFDWNN